MKPVALIIAAALVITAGVWLAVRRPETVESTPPPPPPDPATLHAGAMALNGDEAEVFRRAFWRKPDATDKILHAERREWTENKEDGISHWQWFIAAEPGPALLKWLRDDNAFGVRPAKTAVIKGAPAWFPSDLSTFDLRTGGSGGSLALLFSQDGKTLYATSSGKGFTPGVSAPARTNPPAGQPDPIPGRLPAGPPPNPSK